MQSKGQCPENLSTGVVEDGEGAPRCGANEGCGEVRDIPGGAMTAISDQQRAQNKP